MSGPEIAICSGTNAALNNRAPQAPAGYSARSLEDVVSAVHSSRRPVDEMYTEIRWESG